MILEIVVFSAPGALIAQDAGADRIELCSAPLEGGLTPGIGSVRFCCEMLDIPVHVMIRPREGDFIYSDREFDVMHREIEAVKDAGAAGIVLGLINKSGMPDTEKLRKLIRAAGSLSITFHRAFDQVSEPTIALKSLIDCGVNRILTSGGKNTALEGIQTLANLVHQAGSNIIIMPGGGINPSNILQIQVETGASEFHLSAKKLRKSPAEFVPRAISLGMGGLMNETDVMVPDVDMIRKIKNISLI